MPSTADLLNLFFRAANTFEKRSAGFQGKGYGGKTVALEVRLCRKLLPISPAIAVDIGGNIGNYTAALRKSFPVLEIHTFEPSLTNVQKLKRRFSGDRAITIVASAVSNRSGPAILFSDSPGSGLASLVQRQLDHIGVAFDAKEEVSTLRFEDYWTDTLQCRAVDLVKMDIEGHELAALEGFGKSMEAIGVVQFEFGGCNIDTRTYFKDFWTFFSDNDYDLYRIAPWGLDRIGRYRESDECFLATNFLAANRKKP
jgi:FkbM family methyltransferase